MLYFEFCIVIVLSNYSSSKHFDPVTLTFIACSNDFDIGQLGNCLPWNSEEIRNKRSGYPLFSMGM